MWGIVALVLLVTIAISFGSRQSYSQKESVKAKSSEDLSKYAVADYDAPESSNAAEREERKQKNSRYDNQKWVIKKPHPEDSGVGLFDEIPPPPLIPDVESDLVIVGEIINVSAHLSNDKRGVYSEFTIKVKQILKNDLSKKVEQGGQVTADRAGGFVRYPNGQKVLYMPSTRALPMSGEEYLFFLKNDKKGPNYEIITGYELKENDIKPLDTGRDFDEFKKLGGLNFINTVRNQISESLMNNTQRKKP